MKESYRQRKRQEAQAAELAQLRADTDAISATIGDSGTAGYAPDNIKEGELFMAGGAAYVALEAIARGERLRDGSNVRRTTVTEYVTELAKEA